MAETSIVAVNRHGALFAGIELLDKKGQKKKKNSNKSKSRGP
jgi:hypothetical protein